MRIPLQKLSEQLGLERALHPYETQPWVHYDEDLGITCSAEVRMGPSGEELEAEIQFLYDNPEDHNEEGEGEGDGNGGAPPPVARPGTSFSDSLDRAEEDAKMQRLMPKTKPPRIIDGREQVMIARMSPVVDALWGMDYLTIRGEDFINKIHNWEEQGCEFFNSCIAALQMGELPDIEDLVEDKFKDDKWGGGKSGRVGRKSPKIKPGQLMGMKKT